GDVVDLRLRLLLEQLLVAAVHSADHREVPGRAHAQPVAVVQHERAVPERRHGRGSRRQHPDHRVVPAHPAGVRRRDRPDGGEGMSGESEVAARRCLLGVDLGGTRLRLLVERPDGDREPLVTTAAPGSYAELIETIALQARAAPVAVDAVGLGIPGTCHGSRAGFVPALPWLDGRDVGADLSARLAAEVTVANDAQLSLLAEARTGAARDADSAIMVTVGTGIGGAMMLGGRLWRGAHGSAGSWGWLDAAEAEPDAVHGPFEQVASGSALDALAGDIGGEDVVERARRGERGAQQIVETYARRLGRGLAGLCSALDPE